MLPVRMGPCVCTKLQGDPSRSCQDVWFKGTRWRVSNQSRLKPVRTSVQPVIVELFQPRRKCQSRWPSDCNWQPLSHSVKYDFFSLARDMFKNNLLEALFFLSPPHSSFFFFSFCPFLCLTPRPVDYSIHPGALLFVIWQCSSSSRTANGFVNMSCMVIYSHLSSCGKKKQNEWVLRWKKKVDGSSDESPKEDCFVK